ncbi:MAG: hypothetical protein ACRDQA_03545 [Nocardioidaceae bacterium]
MTFQKPVWAVDGVEVSGQLMRAELKSASKETNGIDGPAHLKVSELATPGAGVRIAGGKGIILGQETGHQGSYFAENLGDHELDIDPTGASKRSDLVIVRAEDPTASSQWTQDPVVDGVVFPRVVEDVLDDAIFAPVNQSAFPLARVDIPANTSVITDDMIVDLRRLRMPHKDEIQRVINLQSDDPTIPDKLTRTSWPSGSNAWPDKAYWHASMQRIPEWAHEAVVMAWVSGLSVTGDTGQNVHGRMRVQHGTLNTQGTQFHRYVASAHDRMSITIAGNMPIDAAHRGTYADVAFQAYKSGGNADLVADWGTVVAVNITYYESPHEQGWAGAHDAGW